MGFVAGFVGVVLVLYCARRWRADERAELALALGEELARTGRSLSDRQVAVLLEAIANTMHGPDRDLAGYLRRNRPAKSRAVIAMQLLAARSLAGPTATRRLDRLRALVMVE